MAPMRVGFHTAWVVLVLCIAAVPAAAQQPDCTPAAFNAVFDDTSRALRDLNARSEQRFRDKLAKLGTRRGWSAQDRAVKGAAILHDKRVDSFNSEIETLIARMDSLAAASGQGATCESLAELKRVRDQLLTLMGQKSGYLLAKLDAELAPPPPVRKAPPPAPNLALAEKALAVPAPPPAAQGAAPAATAPPQPPAPAPQMSGPSDIPVAALPEGPSAPAQAVPQATGEPPVLLGPPRSAEGFTIDEIREAGSGVFGTLSAELAGLINRIFQRFGRPNGYIIGTEGGGAILAGLRYGGGSLHLAQGPVLRIFWQGPSVGIDFGASGSRTMFLVYNLADPGDMYGRFKGVDGAAYFAGGVGLTLLVRSGVLLVPIRSGIGLRFGASLAYLKFTDRQTWNPF